LLLAAVSSAPLATADDGEGIGPYLRTRWTTSRVVGFPEPPPPLAVERAFPALKFTEPLYLICEPGTQRVFVIERAGRLLAFGNREDVPAAQQLLDVKHDAYGLTFHPRYAENGFVYLFGNARQVGQQVASDGESLNVISRFTIPRATDDAGDASRVEGIAASVAASETTIITWESNGHNGGDLAFGPDGYLYITAGDGTSSSDPKETGQDLSDLLSGMIRIDVDRPEAGRQYAIPPDNPFVGLENVRPELWAYGFRNPWRMSFDPRNGELWLGDIGQDAWEFVYRVLRAGNYGWAVREGSHPFQLLRRQGPTAFVPPVIEHPHSEARSIVGGHVYLGERFPELHGAYVYGDYETGRIWALWWDGRRVTRHEELASTRLRFLNLCFDPAGEILLADFSGGDLHRLVPAPPADTSQPFPRRLSETGLFDSVAEHRMAAGVVPYDVNAPLWSDGAAKQRYLAIPGHEPIDYQPQGAWGLPEGTVLVKTFSLELAAGDPASLRRVETRLLTRTQGHWHGYSYAWNDEQTDAVLVEAAGANREYAIADSKSPAGARTQTWHYPSRAECMMCHSRAAAYVLGLNTAQMNRTHRYGDEIDNQVAWLDAHGYFRTSPTRTAGELARLADPADETAPLEQRVKAYLHVNCSICHVADGGGNSRMELGYQTPRAEMQVVGVKPQHDALGVADALLVAPGEPDRSLLVKRMETLTPGRMPRLATSVVDEQAVQLLRAWIEQLPR
jgi:uncharacterized repeat protein (TIGR03806 family)